MSRMKYDYESFVGKKFGKLKVLSVARIDKKIYFNCKCDCGTKKAIEASNILRGLSRSCGCERGKAAKKRRIPRETVNEIIKLRVSGMSYGEIGKRLNLSRTCVCSYCLKNEDTIKNLKENLWTE